MFLELRGVLDIFLACSYLLKKFLHVLILNFTFVIVSTQFEECINGNYTDLLLYTIMFGSLFDELFLRVVIWD